MNPIWPVLVVGSVFSVLFSEIVPMQNRDYEAHTRPPVEQTLTETPTTHPQN